MKRSMAAVLSAALVLGACTATSSDVKATKSDSSTPDATSVVTNDTEPDTTPIAVLVDGRVTDEAVGALIADDGTVNEGLRRQFGEEFIALSADQQAAVLADLSRRVELAAATVSGLEAVIGGPDATATAVGGAWGQVGGQVAALDPTAPLQPATPSGLRRSGSHPSSAPSAGAVGAVGLALGFFGLGATADAVVSAANDMGPDAYAESYSKGSVITGALEQSTIELEYEGTQDGVNVTFKASAVVHPCPTADGSFDIEATIDTKTSKGNAGQNATIDLKITGHVDDDANIADTNVENHTQWSDFGGGKGQFLDFTYSGPSGLDNFTLNRSGGTVTGAFVALATFLSGAFGYKLADNYISAAQKAWLSGRCVKLEPTVSAGPKGMQPSATSEISAAPRSKLDGGPVGGTVIAALTAGGARVEPMSTKLPADATFNYTAPDEKDKTGTVSLEARSKRGVAKAEITFDTSAKNAYVIVGGLQDFQVNQTVCDIMVPFVLESPGVATMTLTGGLTGTYSATGVFGLSYTGEYTIDLPNGPGQPGTMTGSGGGSIAGEAGSGTETYTLTPTTC